MSNTSYNGYSWPERQKKFEAYKKLVAEGVGPYADVHSCQLCGDPGSKLAPHSEDYSKPYRWGPPYEFMICGACHSWLHKRFGRPADWRAFKNHVRRGGYGSEFTAKKAERRLDAIDPLFVWQPIDGRANRSGLDWWEAITLAPETLSTLGARPRP
jgi:hypothetical protein